MPRHAATGVSGLGISDRHKDGRNLWRLRYLCRIRIPGTRYYKGKCFETYAEALAWGKPRLADMIDYYNKLEEEHRRWRAMHMINELALDNKASRDRHALQMEKRRNQMLELL